LSPSISDSNRLQEIKYKVRDQVRHNDVL
jgi:hypothetical protein